MKTPKKPDMESKYFSRLEFENLRRLSLGKKEKLHEDELKKLKEQHWKHCSNCGWDMEEIAHKGLTVWKCFSCGGVFVHEKDFESLFGTNNGILKSILDIFKY